MAKSEDLWLLCYGSASQRELIKSVCFEKCGKGLIGELSLLKTKFIPCKQTECEYSDESLEIGEYMLALDGRRNLIVRKLRDEEAHVEMVADTFADSKPFELSEKARIALERGGSQSENIPS